MKHRWILIGAATVGSAACGPMPGYYPRQSERTEDLRPRALPAPERETAEDSPPADEAEPEVETSEVEPGDEALTPEPEPPRPPKPPRQQPASNWTPDSEPAPPQTPEVPPAQKPSPVRTIELDKETSYIIDDTRGLCFFQHKGSLAPVDCARLKDATARPEPPAKPAQPTRPEPPARTETPARPEPPARTEPNDKPTPARPLETKPTAPTPDEMTRFEAAFSDIFCDRKAETATAPEDRIAARGLSVRRYEAIEAWWSSDENAWWTLTQRAASSCR